MLSSPRTVSSSGDKRFFGRYQEEYYRYHSAPFAGDSDYEKLGGSGTERQSMPTELPIEPHEHDVLMGRGGRNNQHSGNEILRQFARVQGEQYRISSKKGKSALSRYIVRQVHELNPPARFLKRIQQTAAWEEVSDDTAREKASQALRDAVGGLLEGSEEISTVEPLPIVSAPVSLDDQEHADSRAGTVRPRPPDFHPSMRIPTLLGTSETKRRRYSSNSTTFPSFDERHPSQVAGYSPIRRHSESSYHQTGVHTDPTSRRSSQNDISQRSFPGDRQQQQQNLGNLDEFDLFNGELLESDNEEEGPLPPYTHSGGF